MLLVKTLTVFKKPSSQSTRPVFFLAYLGRIYLAYLAFFFLNRSLFVAFNAREIFAQNAWEGIALFFRAWPLDHATACYFLLLALVLQLGFIAGYRLGHALQRFAFVCIVGVLAALAAAEIPVYDNWGVKLNYKALEFLSNPSEVMATASWGNHALFLIWLAFSVCAALWVYNRFLQVPLWYGKGWFASQVVILALALIVFGGRGGFRPIPVNHSDVYFSSKEIVNTAAVNSGWNLLHSYIQNAKMGTDNPYALHDSSAVKAWVRGLHDSRLDGGIELFDVEHPNVVFVVLESWSADMVHAISKQFESVTPHFNALSKEGLLFTRCLGSGFRSDQGFAGMFGGFPAQPKTSIVKQPAKYKALPRLLDGFKAEGYASLFLFGGQLSFGNIEAFMYHQGFDQILTQDDFDSDVPGGRLSVHDEYLFDRALEEIEALKPPFFASIYTQSSHHPFDHPKDLPHIPIAGRSEAYVNSVHYSDWCLGRFMEAAKQSDWYKETVFIFMADHSYRNPLDWPRKSYHYKTIPWLMYGPALNDSLQGLRIEKWVNQTDLAATLLPALGMDASAFVWSQNVFSQGHQSFGFHSFDNGMGWVNEEGALGYDYGAKKIIESEGLNSSQEDSILRLAQYYMQQLIADYQKH